MLCSNSLLGLYGNGNANLKSNSPSARHSLVDQLCFNLTQEKHLPLNEEDNEQYEPVNYEICCLLAEGSQTCFVSNFSSMVELYKKIADCFDIVVDEVRSKSIDFTSVRSQSNVDLAC